MTPRLRRRDFLRTVAAGGLVAGLKPARGSAVPPASRKMTMDLVCGNLGVGVKLPEAVALAARHGFESVGADAGYLATVSDAHLETLKAAMTESKLVFGAAGLSVDFRGDDTPFRDGLKRLPAEAKGLQRAGVTRVGTWIRPGDEKLTYLANFRRHADRLREVAKVLGDHGVRFGLEYVGPKTSWTAARYPFVHTMAEARELIDAIGRKNVGLVLDSWHWYCAGESAEAIRALSNADVVAVDLNDAPAGIPVDRQKDLVRDLPAATGVIDLKGFLSALQAVGYDGPVRAEPFKAELRTLPPDEAVARTARAMQAAFALVGG